MPEVKKIARFIGIEACKSIFSENSTFVLRSPEYYRRLYETTAGSDTKGDRNEGMAETVQEGTADFTDFVVSCWTVLKDNKPTRDEWDIFKEDEQNVAAIVTTPSLVCKFLNKALRLDDDSAQRRFPFFSLDHQKVDYRKQHIDHTNIADLTPFAKNRDFEDQQEYRFVLKYAKPPVIDSFVFCAGIDYMERRDDSGFSNFVNPEISQQNREKLLMALLTALAGYGDFASSETHEFPNADFRQSVSRQVCRFIANGEILF